MSLETFHLTFRHSIQETVAERVAANEGLYPSEELVFAEMVMERLEEARICDDATVCHFTGRDGNAKLALSGYSFSMDDTSLDIFVTKYFGSDTLTDLGRQEVAATATQAFRFLKRAQSGRLEGKIDPTHEVRLLIERIRTLWAQLDRIRIFVITDGVTKEKRFKDNEIDGKTVGIEAVDIERLFRHADGAPRDELIADFKQMIDRALPCVHVPDPAADYEYALTAIPGKILYELYHRYGTRLLESNVRAFLGKRRLVNKGIATTLKNEPEHFLAYNNGLVIVCDDAALERTDRGDVGIASLSGLQIVNGGQTTSSIYFGARDDKSMDLTHVMVPAKIIILKGSEADAREDLISKVSRYANSQNAVKVSDLSANRPFHVQLEQLANKTWCPDGVSKWFYERASGSYQVLLMNEGTTQARLKAVRKRTPTKRKLTKNDIAKYHEAWRGLPHHVASGGEKNFVAFMSAIDTAEAEGEPIIPDPLDTQWYREMIAKVIIFQAISTMIKSKEAKATFRQGYVNIATYTVAIFSERLGERVDLQYIWKEQDISPALSRLLLSWAKVVNDTFNAIAPGQQFSEVAKRRATWDAVREARYPEPMGSIPELKLA